MEAQKTRAQMDARYTWKLEDIFPSDSAWEAEYAALAPCIAQAASFAGKLETALPSALPALAEAELRPTRLYAYARMRRDEDNGNTFYQGLADRAQALAVQLSTATAYFGPEILALGREKVEAVLHAHPELCRFRRLLEEQLRLEAHTLPAAQEKLLAAMGELAGAPDTVYSMLTDADLKFGCVTNEKGETVELTHGRFIPLQQCEDRAVREAAYRTYYAAYRAHTNTIAATYAASVKKDAFFARARSYGSAREQSLFENEIPESVYDALIEAVHRHLPAMHRYLALRKAALRLPELRFWDIYAPIVPEGDLGLPYEEAAKLVQEGLAPLGEAYIRDLSQAFTSGWIDVYENAGKTSGAYSWGVYGTHPYVLLNYQKTLDSLFTIAHELGHAMHSYYSDKNQSFLNSEYPLFLAEIASTTNEAILLQSLKRKWTDRERRMALCNYQLEQIRGTVYRQTLFAEFEREVHAMAARGEALTAESLTAVYRALNERYYKGAVVDDDIASEWMRIPHFYRAFYVYQYATGYSAAVAFSRRVLSGDAEKREKYLGFLAAGGSQPPLETLRRAGVDMESPEPVEECLRSFEEALDELETLMKEA